MLSDGTTASYVAKRHFDNPTRSEPFKNGHWHAHDTPTSSDSGICGILDVRDGPVTLGSFGRIKICLVGAEQ